MAQSKEAATEAVGASISAGGSMEQSIVKEGTGNHTVEVVQ